MDVFLAWRAANVAAVNRDGEGEASLAVTLEDDPAAELHAWFGRYFYFYPDEVEPLSNEPDAATESGATPPSTTASHPARRG